MMNKFKMDHKKKLGQRILHFSFTKILIGIIVCTGVFSFGQIGLRKLMDFSSFDQEYKSLIIGIIYYTNAVVYFLEKFLLEL